MIAKTFLSKDKVCAGCGGKLTLIDTRDNSGTPTKWRGCERCSCFENGVSKETFEIAKILFFQFRELYYHRDKQPDELFCGKFKDLQTVLKEGSHEIKYYCTSELRGLSHFIDRVFMIKEQINKEQK